MQVRLQGGGNGGGSGDKQERGEVLVRGRQAQWGGVWGKRKAGFPLPEEFFAGPPASYILNIRHYYISRRSCKSLEMSILLSSKPFGHPKSNKNSSRL